jgi:hypothetical protein
MGADDSMGQDDPMPRDPAVANPFLGETVGGMLAAMAARVPEVPRHVRIVADVPRTPGPHGDKVQRAKLRELFLAETARRPDSRSCPPAPG